MQCSTGCYTTWGPQCTTRWQISPTFPGSCQLLTDDNCHTNALLRSCSHSITHSPTHSLTHLPTHALTLARMHSHTFLCTHWATPDSFASSTKHETYTTQSLSGMPSCQPTLALHRRDSYMHTRLQHTLKCHCAIIHTKVTEL